MAHPSGNGGGTAAMSGVTHTSTNGGSFTLPPLSQMTQGIAYREDLHKTPSSNEVRDSGNWSMPSKHSSTVSSNPGLHLQTILNPSDSPSARFSTGSASTPSGHYSASTTHSANTPHQTLPHLNQAYQNRDSVEGTFLDSRRSSIDSGRVSSNLASLQLSNPASPYDPGNAGVNASRASLASNLSQQRGIHSSASSIVPRLNGASGPACAPRPGSSRGAAPRMAPQIMGPRSGGAPDPTASTPTKGYAWAFPDTLDEEMESPESSTHESITSSNINGMDTHGGHATHHHHPYSTHSAHALQPKSVTSLQSLDSQSVGQGNYSRTPELRITHKLAERKRRSEMKDLFDQLNVILPNSPGSKTSKWEVLTKAIEHLTNTHHAIDRLRRESEQGREERLHAMNAIKEYQIFQAESVAMYQHLCRIDPKNAHVYAPHTHNFVQAEKQQQQQSQHPATHHHASAQPAHMPSVNGQAAQHHAGPNGAPSSAPPPPPSWSGAPPPTLSHEYSNGYPRR